MRRKQVDVINRIYDASLSVESWQGVLDDMSALLDGRPVVVGTQLGPDRIGPYWSIGIDRAAIAAFKARFGDADANGAGLLFSARPPLYKTILWSELCPPQAIRDLELYRELMRPLNVFPDCAAILAFDSEFMCLFSAQREEDRPGVTPQQQMELDEILPHVGRALTIARRLHGLEAVSRALGEVIESCRFGVLLVNERGRVSVINRTGEIMLGSKDGLTLRNGVLRARSPGMQHRLDALIRDAARTGAGHGTGAGGTLAVPRPSQGRPYTLLVAPLAQGRHEPWAGRPAVAVFIADPELHAEAPLEVFARIHKLSPAQAQIARMLIEGLEQAEIADRLGITRNTLKTHVRRLYDKVDCASRSELIRLVMTAVGAIAAPTPPRGIGAP